MGFADDKFKTTGLYVKFKSGDNRLRILGEPIVGYEGWTQEKGGKPVRKPPKSAWSDSEVYDASKIRRFFSVAVWNYSENCVQVMHATQSAIQKGLYKLATDEDWGEPAGGGPYEYDIVVNRTGEGMQTEYTVTPKPKKPLDPIVAAEWARVQDDGFDITVLFSNGDPFNPRSTKHTADPSDFEAAGRMPDDDETLGF